MHVLLLGTCVGCLLLNILHLMGFEVLWTSLDMINSSTVLRRVGICYVCDSNVVSAYIQILDSAI